MTRPRAAEGDSLGREFFGAGKMGGVMGLRALTMPIDGPIILESILSARSICTGFK